MANKKITSEKRYEYQKEFDADRSNHDNYVKEYDAYEAMLLSKTYDSVSRKTRNGITDGDAATMIIERSARVVGQLPDGETVAAGKKDKGKGLFMDILRQKWIYPNANAQRPFLDKIRLWEMYSGVYGAMPMYYDWDVSPSGYTGPNCWLWNPRNFIPQHGRYSIADMDRVHAIAWLSHDEIQNLIDNWTADSGWDKDNLMTTLEASKNSSKSLDSFRDTYTERNRSTSGINDRVQIVTRYESGDKGKWITFTPDVSNLELRNIDNPHKNGRIPFVIKPCIPLFDSFYNLSDMARAKPIQFAKDGLTNFYFQGIKMNIYPPTVVNAQGILKHTVSNEPGSIWEEIIPNSARRLETSTAGLATYQAAMSQMSGALQNVFGTTTTQMSSADAMTPQFGKTPEAIKYQTGRESARDNQNRAYLQSAIEELMDGMMSLIPNMGTEAIPIDLFSDEIAEIEKAGYKDIADLIAPNQSKKTGRLIIDPKKLKGVEYRFNMKADSTIKADKEETRQNLKDLMSVLGTNANVLQEIQQTTGKMPNWEQILQTYVELSDLPTIDTAFVNAPPQPKPEDHPVIKMLETLNIKFETLPEDVKHALIMQIFGIQSQMPSPTQQNVDIKTAQAHTQATQAGAAQAPPPAPQSQSVGGQVYTDPLIGQVANDLHNMRPQPQGVPNASQLTG